MTTLDVPDVAPERAVLGGPMLDPGRLPVIRATIRPEDFWLDGHGAV